MKKPIICFLYLSVVAIGVLLVCGCSNEATIQEPVESVLYPTPADNLSELIKNLNSSDMLVRLVSIRELHEYGPESVLAVPALILNLYENPSDIRRAAAIELGIIGPGANESVQDLINVLQTDEAYQVRVSAADALGKIGLEEAIPALADFLYDNQSLSSGLSISCANAIALITGEEFTDVDSRAYTLNKEGTPLIVVDAREWWESTGKNQNWSIDE